MYSYGSKAQCSHGEESSSHLGAHLPSSHSYLSPLCRGNHYYYFFTNFTECLMNTEASANVCAHLSISPLSTQKEAPYTPCSVPSARVSGRLCYLYGQMTWLGQGEKWELVGTVVWQGHGQGPEMECSSVDFLSWVLPILSCLLDQLFVHKQEYFWSPGGLLRSSLSS